MLILTPTPLETAAERAFFAELSSWETGGSVRGGVMAALPVVDGPMQRRQADAVLFVPEGLALVRVVEVVRQSGVVTATADGAWTVGAGAGPGDVLQLAGGGSTPLEGLMRAGMDAAVRLRRSGLEPGRIARLTVLTGAVTGLLPADGDLGDGDQVAVLDPRSLLLGVARVSRYTGTDNPRLWTTADVRSGIEALGVAGRIPSVEELNGEGFPYSPYVLRRRELIEPMNLPSARGAAFTPTPAGPTATPPTPEPMPSRTAAAGPLVDPAAAARIAAAAVQAQEAAGRQATETAGTRETAEAAPAIRVEPAGAGDTQVAGQAPAPADPVPAAPAPQERRAPTSDTLALPAEPVPAEQPRGGSTAAVVGPRNAPDDTGGIGGLFGDTPSNGTPGADSAVSQDPPTAVGWDGGWASTPTAPPASRRRPRGALLLALVLAFVVLLGVGGWLLLGGNDAGAGTGTSSAAAATSAPASGQAKDTPTAGETVQLGGMTYTMQAGRLDDTCRGHAYGAVANYLAQTDCLGLSRALWSAQVDGQPAVVSLSRIVMPNAATASALRALTDGNGTGNISDLLREGVSYSGAPKRLHDAEYASALDGATVTVVETSWSTGAQGTSAALGQLAGSARALPVADAPGMSGN